MRGLFITFEGVEGSGKSTQAKLFADWLKEKGRELLYLREPGSTQTGEKIRQILLYSESGEISPKTELFLFLASRAQLLDEKIIPALNKGMTVVLDRYSDSTFAYQCYGHGLPLKKVKEMDDFATFKLKPDITFLLDLDIEQGLKKAGLKDRIEKKGLDYHKKVQKGYHELIKKSKGRIHLIKVKSNIFKTQAEIRKIFSSQFLKV